MGEVYLFQSKTEIESKTEIGFDKTNRIFITNTEFAIKVQQLYFLSYFDLRSLNPQKRIHKETFVKHVTICVALNSIAFYFKTRNLTRLIDIF